ncbi:hypothetical protein ABW19_dt0202111 [Dactylella cylindrospora]|nr:hypothetical protein ABW19_dt0202111 [Dactylella cylindrospora]
MSRLPTFQSGLLLLALLLNIANTFAQQLCDETPLTITTVDQLEELGNCTSVPGDLTVYYVDAVNVTLDSLHYVGGMMQIHLADRSTKISAANLTSIGGLFMIAGGIEGQSNMRNISMPLLNTTAGLDFTSMPKLRELEFPGRINNPVPAIRITIMNTGLDSIEGMNIDYTMIQQVYFGGNPNLSKINLGLTNITVNLDIDGSGAKPNVSFPELGYLNTANIHDVSSLDLGKVEYMGGALGVYDCTDLLTLDMPMLKQIGTKTVSVLTIANNTELENVLFPELEIITGGITTENNKNWRRLNGFPQLKLVTDDVEMKGTFTFVEFPMLYNLTGNFSVISSAGLTYNCRDLEKMNTDTSKPFICDPYGTNVFRAAAGEEPESKKSAEEALTGPKITGIAIGCLAAVIIPLLFIRWLIVRRRKKNMLREKDHFSNFHAHGPRELDSRSTRTPGSRVELPTHAFGMPYELPAAKLRPELQGDIPMHEMDDGTQGYKNSAEVTAFPIPDSPIERVYSSRLGSEISSDDEDDGRSSMRRAGDNVRPQNMIS